MLSVNEARQKLNQFLSYKYVYGTKCERLTADKYYALKNMYGSNVWNSDKQKIGQMCTDCSGLIYGVTGVMKGSSQYLSDAKAKGMDNGTINTIPNIPMICVWRQGHIGWYIGNGKVIEARGSQYNVVTTNLAQRDFTHWFKSPYIDYSEVVNVAPKPSTNVTSSQVTAHSIGEHVTFTTCYKSETAPNEQAILACNMSRNHGVITKIAYGKKNPYLLDSGLCWVNDGDISGQYKESSSPTISARVGKCTASVLNVRSGAGTEYPVIRQLNQGNLVDIIGEEHSSDGALWYHINIVGTKGYVNAKYLQ